MIARIWEGYTTPGNADAYSNFLKTEFLPAIEKKNINGYRKFQLIKRELTNEVHFITIMWFDSLEQIKQFAGNDYEKAVIHPKAQALLKKHDLYAKHLELIHELNY